MASSMSTTTRGAQGMGRLYREWRKRRDQAGILLGYVAKAVKASHGEEAWRIYEDWRSWRISFEEARKRLEKLLAEARAAARA